MLIGDFAHNLFQKVFNGNQTGSPAILVHHNRHVKFSAPELFQEFGNFHQFRYKKYRPHYLTYQQVLFAFGNLSQNLPGIYDAHNIIHTFPVNRKTGMSLFNHQKKGVKNRGVFGNPHDIYPWLHYIGNDRLPKLHHAAEHLPFFFRQRPFLLADFYQCSDFFVADVAGLRRKVTAKETNYTFGYENKQFYQRV